MRLGGVSFENSPTCKGIVYTPTRVNHDIACIEITGRYLETGWAVNHEAHETVYVVRGMGELAHQSSEVTQLAAGDVVTVPPKTPFAWSGDMTIVMVCEPSFDPEQYEIIGESN